jgi:hypothetical protein
VRPWRCQHRPVLMDIYGCRWKLLTLRSYVGAARRRPTTSGARGGDGTARRGVCAAPAARIGTPDAREQRARRADDVSFRDRGRGSDRGGKVRRRQRDRAGRRLGCTRGCRSSGTSRTRGRRSRLRDHGAGDRSRVGSDQRPPGGPQCRHSRSGTGADDQQGVPVGTQRDRAGRCPGARRRSGVRRCRGHGVNGPGPLSSPSRAGGLPHGRRRDHRFDDLRRAARPVLG